MMRKENVMDGYAKIDQYNPKKIRSIARKYTSILEDIGEDPNREGLARNAGACRQGAAVPDLTVMTWIPRKSCARRCSPRNTSRW